MYGRFDPARNSREAQTVNTSTGTALLTVPQQVEDHHRIPLRRQHIEHILPPARPRQRAYQCLRAYHSPAVRCLHSPSILLPPAGQLRYRPSLSHIYSAVKFGSDSALVSAVDTRAPRLHVRIDTSESTGGKARNRCGFVARPSSPQA